MAWLTGGWGKRVEITVADVGTTDLTHFPLLLKLGASVGTGTDDVSFIFDELTSDANRKKIAVTKSDGTTEIYVEIEKWDDANEAAWLWVSKSDLVLSSSATTTLYLYFDSTHADNTTYVADAGSRAEVWDSSNAAVFHLNESSGGAIDSLGDQNGVYQGDLPTPAAVGELPGQDLDGTGDYVTAADHAGLDVTGNLTIEMWVDTDVASNNMFILVDKTGSSSSNASYGLWYDDRDAQSNPDRIRFLYGDTNTDSVDWDASGIEGVLTYIVARYDGTDHEIFADAVSKATAQRGAITPAANALNLGIGAIASSGSVPLAGLMSEVRISATDRSDAWILANFNSQKDNLVAWGGEEVATSIKLVIGVPIANVKTINGGAIANVKSFLGVSNVS